ncbi:tRNA guanosine(34) transglycosylase Tgt [Candidatus Gromoviella agglomerans]|uniref:tRNA guanosine(34) transglycosylase Tgt n=1 Tax=Candidatus Gromoviella agglomerans TaxID=2806609 RepID=UPI001E2C7C35|nr:tRNA guanosine(34) transglycosylase Tgt [Candidatus Gromoviella agglomerans]UFX98167.1 Queuine tRNA-ribosyltransferase [Candidatus Gromoviella agglomerans]
MYNKFRFFLHNYVALCRTGCIETPHGEIQTPAFVFCGTKASIKGLSIDNVMQNGTQIILGNTYHLMLQPGENIIFEHGGLHNFTGWNGPMMTDSGGFQIFSLGHGSVSSEIKRAHIQNTSSLVKITNDGAIFKSYINGDTYMLTPEKSMEIQVKLGADLCFAFDECTAFNVPKEYTANSMRRSHEWEYRSLSAFSDLQKQYSYQQALYGIVQGGVYLDLREESAKFISDKNFFGNAIGGSLGGNQEQMYEIVEMTANMLKKYSIHKPIHLLGIGRMKDIVFGVSRGIDTFDCVHPTRIARHGCALILPSYDTVKSNLLQLTFSSNREISLHYKDREFINLNNSIYANDKTPIQNECNCTCCIRYSKSYIHHLFKAKEILALSAVTSHNVFVMNKFMSMIRQCINEM